MYGLDSKIMLLTSVVFFKLSLSLEAAWKRYYNHNMNIITLTHYILNRLTHTIYWKSPISILGTSGYELYIFLEKNG